MGVDFLNRMKKTFHRTLDQRLVTLRTPTMLDADVACIHRSARGNIKNSASLSEGERLMIRESGGKFVALRGNETVIEFQNPPADFADRIQRGGGIGMGQVTVINPISQTAEVSFACE